MVLKVDGTTAAGASDATLPQFSSLFCRGHLRLCMHNPHLAFHLASSTSMVPKRYMSALLCPFLNVMISRHVVMNTDINAYGVVCCKIGLSPHILLVVLHSFLLTSLLLHILC